MTLLLRYAVRSDRGLVRGNNEDSVYAGPRLLAIADGMGGHAAGEVASKIVVRALEHLDEDRPVDDLLASLREAVHEANATIADMVDEDSSLEGMGTTLTAMRFVGSKVGLVHVGDSRAYLMRGDQLSQITHDDTYVQSLVDSGRLTAEEASHHPRKSVILRALTGVDVEPDVSIREVRVGDRYLLCSDGLTDVVSTQTLYETLSEGAPQECADRLVELALRGGGPDNVTCIVADVVESDFGDEVPVIGGAFVDGDEPEEEPADPSPAERAARMTRPKAPPPSEPAPAPPRRRWWRRGWIFVLIVILVLAAGTVGTYAWTQSQYFVGKDGDHVAVFRGVHTKVGPVRFYRVDKTSTLTIDDLVPAARSQVESGITAHDLNDANAIVARLAGQTLPPCPTAIPTPSPTPTPTPTHRATTTHTRRSTTPHVSGRSTPHTTAKPTATRTPTPSTTPPAAPTHTPIPNVECKAH